MSEVFDACVGRYYSSYFDELVPDYYSMSLLVGSMPLTVVENDYRIFLHDKLMMQSLLDLKRFVYASLPAGRVRRVSRETLCQQIQMEYNVLSDSLYDIFCIRKTGRIVRRDILKAIDAKIMSTSNKSLMYLNNPFNTFDRQKRFQYNLSDFFEINKHLLLHQFIFDIRNRRLEKMDQLYNQVNASDRATKLFYRRQLQKIRNMTQSQFHETNIPNKHILKEYIRTHPLLFSIADAQGLLTTNGLKYKIQNLPEQQLSMPNHQNYYKWLYLSHYGGSILNVFNYYKRDRKIVKIKNTANNKITIGTDTESKQDNLLVIDVHLVINNDLVINNGHTKYGRSNAEDIYKSIQTDTGDIDSLQFVFKNVKPRYDLPKDIPNLFDEKYNQTIPKIAKIGKIRCVLSIFMAIQELMPHCTLPHCNIDQRIHLQHLSCVILNSWHRNVSEKQKSEIINFNKKGHAFTWFDFYCYFFDNKEFEIIKAIEETKTIRIKSIRDFLIEHINKMPTIDDKPRYKILESSENAPEHYTKLAECSNNQLIFLNPFEFQTTSKNTWKLYRNDYNPYHPHDDLLDVLQHVYNPTTKATATSRFTATLMILSQAQDLFMQVCGLPIDEHREVSSDDEDESY